MFREYFIDFISLDVHNKIQIKTKTFNYIIYKRDTVYERIFIKKITCESSLLKWDIGCGFIVPKNCSKRIISLKKSIRFQADVMKICWQVLPIL